jgi:YD repeat-containing protein
VAAIPLDWTGAVSGSYSYAYDNNFNLVNVTLSGNSTIQRSYNQDGRITQDGPFAASRGGPGGLESQLTDKTGAVSYGYDGVGRPISQTLAVGGAALYSEQVTTDNAGRLAQKVEIVGSMPVTTTYTYDANSELTQVQVQTGTGPLATTEQYAYDANGNRTSATTNGPPLSATLDAQDRLIQQGSTAYTFDADGYLTARATGAITDTFQYSARGELLQATVGGNTVTYWSGAQAGTTLPPMVRVRRVWWPTRVAIPRRRGATTATAT